RRARVDAGLRPLVAGRGQVLVAGAQEEVEVGGVEARHEGALLQQRAVVRDPGHLQRAEVRLLRRVHRRRVLRLQVPLGRHAPREARRDDFVDRDVGAAVAGGGAEKSKRESLHDFSFSSVFFGISTRSPSLNPPSTSTTLSFCLPTFSVTVSTPRTPRRTAVAPLGETKTASRGTRMAFFERASSIVPWKRIPGRIVAGSLLSSWISTFSTFSGSRVFCCSCTVVAAREIVPRISSSGCASSRSVTRCPTATLPASISSTSPLAIIRFRSGISITRSAFQQVSPTFFFSPRQFCE